jgi:hypothetical protein
LDVQKRRTRKSSHWFCSFFCWREAMIVLHISLYVNTSNNLPVCLANFLVKSATISSTTTSSGYISWQHSPILRHCRC